MEISVALIFIICTLFLLKYNKQFALPLAILYLLAVIYLVLLVREPASLYRYSFKLFNGAIRAVEFDGGVIPALLTGDIKVISWLNIKGAVLNILLFVPFGYLLPLLRKSSDYWWKVMLIGLGASFCIEIVQLVTRLGFADVDDLMNNTLGAGIGYLLYRKCLTHVVNKK